MKQCCLYSPDSDILEVQSGLSTSIPEALDFGRIKDTCVPSHYNGQKSLSEVGDRVKEPFDVIEFDRSYTRIRKQINDAEYERKRSESKESSRSA